MFKRHNRSLWHLDRRQCRLLLQMDQLLIRVHRNPDLIRIRIVPDHIRPDLTPGLDLDQKRARQCVHQHAVDWFDLGHFDASFPPRKKREKRRKVRALDQNQRIQSDPRDQVIPDRDLDHSKNRIFFENKSLDQTLVLNPEINLKIEINRANRGQGLTQRSTHHEHQLQSEIIT